AAAAATHTAGVFFSSRDPTPWPAHMRIHLVTQSHKWCAPGQLPGHSLAERMNEEGVPRLCRAIRHLEPEFKRVACRGHQALPRRSAHRPIKGLATSPFGIGSK